MIRCPSCNKLITDDSRFCEYCGTKIDKSSLSNEICSTGEKRICINCGAELAFDAKFCEVCGTKINTVSDNGQRKAEAERLEKERIAKEKAEVERLEAERIAKEKAEVERLEKERIAKEKAEAERLEAERIAKEKAEAERLEKERIAKEKAEAERLEKERIAKEKTERIESERLAKAQAIATKRAEKEAAAKAKADAKLAKKEEKIAQQEKRQAEKLAAKQEKVQKRKAETDAKKKAKEIAKANKIAIQSQKKAEKLANKQQKLEQKHAKKEPLNIAAEIDNGSSKKSRKPVIITICIVLLIAILSTLYFAKNQDVNNPENSFEDSKASVELVRSDNGITLSNGDSYFCWNDESTFKVLLSDVIVENATVYSDKTEVCEVSIKDGMVTCISGIAGEATITISVDDVTADFIWVVDSAYRTDLEKGISLALDDGTIIYPGEDSPKLANSSGITVLYDGNPVSDYKVDVNGLGNADYNTDLGFSCYKTTDGKLLLFTRDLGKYDLTIQYNDEFYSFSSTIDSYRIHLIIHGNPYSGTAFGNVGPNTGEDTRWELFVELDGKRIDDFDVKVSNSKLGEPKKRSENSFGLYQYDDGDNIVTISADGVEKSYIWHCSKPYTGDNNVSRFDYAEPIEKNELVHINNEQTNINNGQSDKNNDGKLNNSGDNAGSTINNNNRLVSDDSGKCGENLKYTFDSKTGILTISGKGAMYDCESYPPTSIPWWKYNTSVKEIIVEEGVSEISNQAFFGCSSVESIVLPKSLKRIGWNAFRNCCSITSIDIPANAYFAQAGQTFAGCTKLETFYVDTANPNLTAIDGVLFSKDKTKLLAYPANKRGNTYTIPDSVTDMGTGMAFSNANYLENITIPVSVKVFGRYLISDCPKLKTVYYKGTAAQYEAIRIDYGSGSKADSYIFPSDINIVYLNETAQKIVSRKDVMMYQWAGDLYDGKSNTLDSINKRILRDGNLCHIVRIGHIDSKGNFCNIDPGSLQSSDSSILEITHDYQDMSIYTLRMKKLGTVTLTYSFTDSNNTVYKGSYEYVMSEYLD